MKIIKTSEGLTFEQFQELSRGERLDNLSESGLEFLDLTAWALFDDLNADGSVTRVLAVMDSDGGNVVTVSNPFITEFQNLLDMCDAYGRRLDSLRILHGMTKAGQEFLTCKIAKTSEL